MSIKDFFSKDLFFTVTYVIILMLALALIGGFVAHFAKILFEFGYYF